MAQYLVLQKSYINNAIFEEGDIITLPDGVEFSENLQLIPEPEPAPVQTKKG